MMRALSLYLWLLLAALPTWAQIQPGGIGGGGGGGGGSSSASDLTSGTLNPARMATNAPSPDMMLVPTSGTSAAWLYRNASRSRPPNLTNLVVSGDSIETHTGGSTNWPSILTNAYPFLRLITNSGVASQKMWTIMQNYQNNFGIWAPGTASNTLAILKAGINDVGQGSNAVGLIGNFNEMSVNLHSNGYYVMAVTLAASGGNTCVGQETNRIFYNAMLRTNKNWDYLFDAANYIPHTSLWYSNDMIHPNNYGKLLYAMGVMDVMNAGLKNPQATQPMQDDNSGPFIFAGMRDTNNFKALSHLAFFRTAASPSIGLQNDGDDSYFGITVAGGNARLYALAAADASVDFPGNMFFELNTSLDVVQTPKSIRTTNGYLAEMTITAGGTTGARTIDKSAGTVNFAAAATAITVTCNKCTSSSLVFATVRTGDSTALIKNVVPGTGSFVITLNAAATAETSVGWWILNP